MAVKAWTGTHADNGAMNDLFPSPAATFDHPLEILSACHERVRRHCRLTGRIAEHLEDEGFDEQVRLAAQSVVRYFDVAGRDHHLDEEEDLFPAMLEHCAGRGGAESLVARLLGDHRKLDALWAEVRAILVELAEGREARIDPALAAAFAAAYDEHIREEEEVLFPLARASLPPPVLAALGASMARRRGVKQ